jgi:hypothetical protein
MSNYYLLDTGQFLPAKLHKKQKKCRQTGLPRFASIDTTTWNVFKIPAGKESWGEGGGGTAANTDATFTC